MVAPPTNRSVKEFNQGIVRHILFVLSLLSVGHVSRHTLGSRDVA
jgi:hypothetical protein